jgi:AraC-like DNA-binding protein
MENTDPQHSTLGSVAVLIDRTLRTYGCDPEPLFRQSGIDIRRTTDPNARFSVTRMQQLWQLAVNTTGDPCFGLSVAAQFQPAALHGLGFAWLASDTLRDALTRLVRFSRLISTATEIHLEDTGSGVTLIVNPPAGWTEYVYASLDAAMAVFLRMCRLTGGNEITPGGVTLVRPRPPCAGRFDREFGAPVTYGTEDNTFAFHQSDVDAILPHANPELARINDQTVVDYLARFDRSSITMQVRKRIVDQLPDGTPHQESIADALHISLRSLQRRLKDEDTNYKQLLESTRQELARQYLRQSHRSIGEITYLLGFSEPGNFTRAFKRWTGKTPAGYRKDE